MEKNPKPPSKFTVQVNGWMVNDGSVSKNVKYRNLCKEQFPVHVAYNDPPWFEIENNTMVKYQSLHGLFTDNSYISYDYEILYIFFEHYDIFAKWINCNYTWGVYDYETGKWTGAV